MAKQRIAILGGGMAALTAAFEITSAPGWQADYEVTVYQLGWRLGGKGASGRNAEHWQRIEEHGLHILFGFYDNAFRVLKACYDELGRSPGAPLATWQDAFKPHSYVVLMDQTGGRYVPWALDFPTNSEEPGTGHVMPTPWAMIDRILGWIARRFVDSPRLPDGHPDLETARANARLRDHVGLHAAIGRMHAWLRHATHRNDAGTDIDWLRDFVIVDLAIAVLRGMIDDRVIFPPHDYFALDTMDFRHWLRRHSAHPISLTSGYVNGVYDLVFSRDGQLGAGTAINGLLRLLFTYKGAVMWKMQAGMGDTIFAPLYLVLSRRGVKFEFFQCVDRLELSDDRRRVARVTIGQQVTVKGSYDPLVPVKGLPCWPQQPRYDQLVQGDALRASGCDLEDWWTAWQNPVPPRVLVDGVDFDTVILGCSIGVFPYIAADLMAASPTLAAMVGAVRTTQTQAMQLWLSRDLTGMGWTLPSPALSAYAEPMNTWADMTHLLVREDWPATDMPRNLAYLCSPLSDDEPPPPRSEHGYAQRQARRVHSDAIEWLTTRAGGLWPAACLPDNPRCLDWSLLVAPGSPRVGPARFDTQYWIATLNPSDRYVLSLPSSVDKRLATDGTGFANLLLAGDYLRTGINASCLEAAAMAGMHASRAICGRPERIAGDST